MQTSLLESTQRTRGQSSLGQISYQKTQIDIQEMLYTTCKCVFKMFISLLQLP